MVHRRDLWITGHLPLLWERRYNSALAVGSVPGPMGRGWASPYLATLSRAPDGFRFVGPDGLAQRFLDPNDVVDRGGLVSSLGTFRELTRTERGYVITSWNVETWVVTRYVFAGAFDKVENAILPLSAIEDAAGRGLRLRHDGAGRLRRVEQRVGGRAFELQYTENEQIATVQFVGIDGTSVPVATFEYDEVGRLAVAWDALGYADRYEYDIDARLIREWVKDGGVFSFAYDQTGRCVRTSGAGGYDAKSFRYFDAIRWTEVTNSEGCTKKYHWNVHGQVLTEIDEVGATRRSTYDDFGRLVSVTDAAGHVTRFAYDSAGNRESIVNALGQESKFAFDESHQPIAFIDHSERKWTRSYDERGFLVQTSDPAGACWTYQYDHRGNLVDLESPTGAHKRLEYTPEGVPHRISDWEGRWSAFRVDAFGRITERVAPGGGITRHSYDLLGRILAVQFPDGSPVSFRYDAAGNMVSHIDAAGRETRCEYGPCRRLRRVHSAAGHTAEYRWGSEPKRLLAIVNGNKDEYLFEYDEAGRLVAEVGWDGRRLAFEYDVAGQCGAYVNGNGQRLVFHRDALGRVIEVILPDGATVSKAYDADGSLAHASNSDCEVTFERDEYGRIVTEQTNDLVVRRRYDPVGTLLETATSLGYRAEFASDHNGLLRSVVVNAHWRMEVARDPDGSETQRLAPGVAIHQDFDANGRLVTQRMRDELWRTYDYDRVGALRRLSERNGAVTSYDYSYDGQILGALHGSGGREAFTIDPAGNISSTQSSAVEFSLAEYGPGGRLLRAGQTGYAYDAHGRVTAKKTAEGTWEFHWTALDELRAVRDPRGREWSYDYDPLGRRIAKREPAGTTTRYLWTENVLLQELGDGKSNTSWTYDPRGVVPLCVTRDDKTLSVITDHIGTPRELVDDRGDVVWSSTYSVWGQRLDGTGHPAACPLRYQGQWFDEESGLHYNRFRYYDPEVGRYLSQDPIRVLGSWNLYAYAADPISWVDPFGLTPLFRGMQKDADGKPVVYSGPPAPGQNAANSLGTRPGEGGMSTNTDPAAIQPHRKPADFGGTQKDSGMFVISPEELAKHGLVPVNDHDTHVSIQTAPGVPPEELPDRLAATRDSWKEVSPDEAEALKKKGEAQEEGC
jgi:RHS repeat-associated protein